ncbi:hypothetical protein NIES22_70690 (plasmid) [Calothrix brevissima NIES-22]|nr:hypothetical protein NIES22_70690 [Calothrix brevissima NIES-22]
MVINRALEIDQTCGGEVLQTLNEILEQLQNFKAQHPQVFRHLCTTGADVTLADAIAAVQAATDYLLEGK